MRQEKEIIPQTTNHLLPTKAPVCRSGRRDYTITPDGKRKV